MELGPDFSEFVESFIAHEVEFLIVGGYAVAAHGHPKATGDLDAWILVSQANSERVITALTSFGFELPELSADDFRKPDMVVQLGYPPNRIDILTAIDGVTFVEAWPNRVEMNLNGSAVPFIGRVDLIRNKLASGRPRDIADAEALRVGESGDTESHSPEI